MSVSQLSALVGEDAVQLVESFVASAASLSGVDQDLVLTLLNEPTGKSENRRAGHARHKKHTTAPHLTVVSVQSTLVWACPVSSWKCQPAPQASRLPWSLWSCRGSHKRFRSAAP